MYTLLHLKWMTSKYLLYSTWNSVQYYVAAWMGGELVGEWIPAWVPSLFTWNYYNIQFSSVQSLKSCLTLCNPMNRILIDYLLSRFSRVWLCVTPWTAAHQAPLSLEFSRQEHWSGFPFPSPMHESEKWKWSRSVMCDSQGPHGLQPTRLLGPWDFPGKKSTGVGCHCLLWLIDYTPMQNKSFLKIEKNPLKW